MDLVSALVVAVWVMLPAYIPNNVAVLAGGGRPIDGGRTWRGKRLLGDGKTWRGTAAGVAAGAVLALLLNAVHPSVTGSIGIELPAFSPAVVIALPAGAMLGDVLASFLKRRSGRERGAAFPGLDQLDFVVGALVLAAIVDWAWFTGAFTVLVIAIVLVITPVLHVSTNAIAYAAGLKNEPW